MRIARRFSLRTAIVGMTLIVVTVGVLSAWRRQALIQLETVAKIEAIGGWVRMEADCRPDWLRDWIGLHYFSRVEFASLPDNFELIPRLRGLLGIESTGSFSDSDAQYLLESHSLRSISLRSPTLTNDGLKQLCKVQQLRILHINGTPLNPAAIVSLTELPKLSELSLAYTDLDDEALAILAQIPNLETLRLSGCNVDGSGFQRLNRDRAFPRLASLDLSGTDLHDAGLRLLATNVSHLKELYLGRTQISDQGIPSLIACMDLEVLDVSRTQVSNTGIEALLGCPDLVRLNVSSTHVTDDCFDSLKSLPRFEELEIGSYQSTSDFGFDRFFELLPTARIRVDGGQPFTATEWHSPTNWTRSNVASNSIYVEASRLVAPQSERKE